jgi:hypothetical protein
MIEKAEDVGEQGTDAAKAARADDLGGDFAKEAFHQIEPGGRGGNEMDVKTGVTLEPGGHLGVLVGGIIVANDVKVELGSHLLIDLAQEGQPLLMAMARGVWANTLPGSPRRQRGSPFHADSSRESWCECVPGSKASRAGCVRGPGTGSFHHSRAPKLDRADRGRGPPQSQSFSSN